MLGQLYILPILLFSVVIHEIAHGWMALKLGDPTAKEMGRLTLNPIPHIDLVGSVIVPLFSLFTAGQIYIAWAKPVPVNPANFLHYRRDDMLVSVVGPFTNYILACFCTVFFILLVLITPLFQKSEGLISDVLSFMLIMFNGGITLNVMLAVFNMIPIPPLDGSHVVALFMPDKMRAWYRNIGFFGIFIILILMKWQFFHLIFNTVITILISPFVFLIHFFVT